MNKETRPNTYNRILDAALKLFNEESERNTTTNHIASHLGISPGNLYYHFRGKDEIIIQLHRRYSSRISKDQAEYLEAARRKPCPTWWTISTASSTSCGHTASCSAT